MKNETPQCKKCKVVLHGTYDAIADKIIPSTKTYCPHCEYVVTLELVAKTAKAVNDKFQNLDDDAGSNIGELDDALNALKTLAPAS